MMSVAGESFQGVPGGNAPLGDFQIYRISKIAFPAF